MIDKIKLITWMRNSINNLDGCIEYGNKLDFDDQHSWGAKDIQNILIKKIEVGDFDV